MYGKWLGITLGGVAAILLLVGLAFAWGPFFAIPIVLLVLTAALAVSVGRRAAAATETGSDPQATARANRPERPDAGKAEPSH